MSLSNRQKNEILIYLELERQLKLHKLLDQQVRYIRECVAKLEELLDTRRTRLDRFERDIQELRDDLEDLCVEVRGVEK